MSNLTQNSLNIFFKEIYLKKKYLKKMQNKLHFFNELRKLNYKKVGLKFNTDKSYSKKNIFITYIIKIYFSKKNTLFRISDFSGNIRFFYSAGSFRQRGKRKIARSKVLRKFYKLLVFKLKFIQNLPVAIHFKNVDSNMSWFLKKLKKQFSITFVKYSYHYSYNGCRKKKVRRKKTKNRVLNMYI